MGLSDLDEDLLSHIFRHLELKEDGFFLALVNTHIRNAIHRAFLIWQRDGLATLRWPGGERHVPLTFYEPKYKTTCLISSCFVSEQRMLFMTSYQCPTNVLHRLIWQTHTHTKSKQRFEASIAQFFPYDPRQTRIDPCHRIQSNLGAYRMTARGVNALLKSATLRIVRRCFLEILSGHSTAKLDPNEPHDRALVEFAGRHGRLDVLALLVDRNPSKGSSFDYQNGLAGHMDSLLITTCGTTLCARRLCNLRDNLVVRVLESACSNGKMCVVRWIVNKLRDRNAMNKHIWTGIGSHDFFLSFDHTATSFQILKTMMVSACANQQDEIVHELFMIAESRASPLFDPSECIVLFLVFWFAVLTTEPTSGTILEEMIQWCHFRDAYFRKHVVSMLNEDIHQLDGQVLDTIDLWYDEVVEEWESSQYATTDLTRIVAIVRSLVHRCGNVLTSSMLDIVDWDQMETTIFNRCGVSHMTKLLIAETGPRSIILPEIKKEGWMHRTWKRGFEGQSMSAVGLRPCLDPERWSRSEAIARNNVRVLLSSNECDSSPFIGILSLQDRYSNYHNTRLHVNSVTGIEWEFGNGSPWLTLGVSRPTPLSYDESGPIATRRAFVGQSQSKEAIGEAVCAWLELLKMQSTTSHIDPLLIDGIRKASCQVFAKMRSDLDVVCGDDNRRLRIQFGRLIIIALDRELSMTRSVDQISIPLISISQWAEKENLIPHDLVEKYMNAMFETHNWVGSLDVHAIAEYALNQTDSTLNFERHAEIAIRMRKTRKSSNRTLPRAMGSSIPFHTPVFDLERVRFRW